MRNHDKMRRINVYLPNILYDQYAKRALKMGVGAAELIRTALAEYLDNRDKKAPAYNPVVTTGQHTRCPVPGYAGRDEVGGSDIYNDGK